MDKLTKTEENKGGDNSSDAVSETTKIDPSLIEEEKDLCYDTDSTVGFKKTPIEDSEKRAESMEEDQQNMVQSI